MFGKQMPIGDFQMPQTDTSVGQPLQMPPTAPKKKGGLFGSGVGGASVIQALLTGYLASRGGPLGAAALQMFQQKRQQAAEQAQYGQRREDEFQDWVRKQAYQQEHPGPINNDTVNDYNFWKGVLPPEQFKEYIANKVNPPQYMNVPGVGLVQVPRMGPQAPSAPVGKLTPIQDGGPMPSASGGFQPSGY